MVMHSADPGCGRRKYRLEVCLARPILTVHGVVKPVKIIIYVHL